MTSLCNHMLHCTSISCITAMSLKHTNKNNISTYQYSRREKQFCILSFDKNQPLSFSTFQKMGIWHKHNNILGYTEKYIFLNNINLGYFAIWYILQYTAKFLRPLHNKMQSQTADFASVPHCCHLTNSTKNVIFDFQVLTVFKQADWK